MKRVQCKSSFENFNMKGGFTTPLFSVSGTWNKNLRSQVYDEETRRSAKKVHFCFVIDSFEEAESSWLPHFFRFHFCFVMDSFEETESSWV